MDTSNELFSLAWQAVEHTSCNLFLTGKAGTGKTTFLKYVLEHTGKNAVVVAPTGVAAIQAGGATIHSFFQLPLLGFIPELTNQQGHARFVSRRTLFQGMRLSRPKIDMLNELELLVIDEVSMVRCDQLDMIDEVLRHFRKNNSPFGGAQVLLIGDMYQLPPVVREEDRAVLDKFYPSPFFFSAKALEKNPLLFIELKKIYRQSDETFIRILNNIRNGTCTEQDLAGLNARCLPKATKQNITLVTHNYQADQINGAELAKLRAPLHRFRAEVKGNFSESAYPCEQELQLKAGAQVMFIKNDSSGAKRYYNGKLATVRKINAEGITVELAECAETIVVEKESWSNMQYRLDAATGRIEEEETGSFTQYPLRLAWAVTIHKSQGLTFDEVIIDGGRSFAAGQMYVALSRCRTLEGITLLSPVEARHIITDRQIVDFSSRENSLHDVGRILAEEKRKYAAASLGRAFSWAKVTRELEAFGEYTAERQLPDKTLADATAALLLHKAAEHRQVAERFVAELSKKFAEEKLDEEWLTRKVTAAKTYFIDKIRTELLAPLNTLQSQLKGRKKVRKYCKALDNLDDFLWKKIGLIEGASYGGLAFEIAPVVKKDDRPAKKEKRRAGDDTRGETLALYMQGMRSAQIAAQRGMALSTIEGHLAELVTTGEVNIHDFIDDELLAKIRSAADTHGYQKLTPIKTSVGDLATFGQIRMALSYLKRQAAG